MYKVNPTCVIVVTHKHTYVELMQMHDTLCGAAHRVYVTDPNMALMWLEKANTLQTRARELLVPDKNLTN